MSRFGADAKRLNLSLQARQLTFGGGRGGNGRFGGGGAGGPSIGIAYVGAEAQQAGTDVAASASPALGGRDGAGVTTGTGVGTLGLTTEIVGF